MTAAASALVVANTDALHSSHPDHVLLPEAGGQPQCQLPSPKQAPVRSIDLPRGAYFYSVEWRCEYLNIIHSDTALTLYGYPACGTDPKVSATWRPGLFTRNAFGQFLAARACFVENGVLTRSINKRCGGSYVLRARIEDATQFILEQGPVIAAAKSLCCQLRPDPAGYTYFNIGFGRKPYGAPLFKRLPIFIDDIPLSEWATDGALE